MGDTIQKLRDIRGGNFTPGSGDSPAVTAIYNQFTEQRQLEQQMAEQQAQNKEMQALSSSGFNDETASISSSMKKKRGNMSSAMGIS